MSRFQLRVVVAGAVASVLVLAACSPPEPDAAAAVPPSQLAVSTTTAAPPPATTSTTTTTTTTTTAPPREVRLPAQAVWAFPGPDHYEGDILTFEVPLGGFGGFDLIDATLTVDGEPVATPGLVSGDPLLGGVLVFPNAFDTEGEVGGHWVNVIATLEPDVEIDVTQRVIVSPAADRPVQEVDAGWQVERTACCNVKFLENSAAERDLDELVTIIDESAEAVEAHFGLELPQVDFVLIDTMWGNGGYAGAEVVVSYFDRDYSPGRQTTFRQTVLHELAHAVTDQIEITTPWPLVEGVAVQFTGGHFKPEPLGPRAKALADWGRLPPLDELFGTFAEMQHETRYAAVGAFTEFLVATYGLPTVLELYKSDIEASGSSWLDQAATMTLGKDLAALQDEFDEWVAGFEAAEHALDLELTVALQDARRAFQATYAPYPNYFIYPSVTETGQNALAMRDPQDPRLVAVEALIAHAQGLIIDGDLEAAAGAVAEVERIVEEGTIGPGMSGEFLAIAEAVAAGGFELLEYEPGDESPTVVVTGRAPDLSLVEVTPAAGEWMIVSVRPAPVSVNALGL